MWFSQENSHVWWGEQEVHVLIKGQAAGEYAEPSCAWEWPLNSPSAECTALLVGK